MLNIALKFIRGSRYAVYAVHAPSLSLKSNDSEPFNPKLTIDFSTEAAALNMKHILDSQGQVGFSIEAPHDKCHPFVWNVGPSVQITIRPLEAKMDLVEHGDETRDITPIRELVFEFYNSGLTLQFNHKITGEGFVALQNSEHLPSYPVRLERFYTEKETIWQVSYWRPNSLITLS